MVKHHCIVQQGSAYITHGHVGDSVKTGASGGGGGGLRAIRMLRK